MHILPGRLDLDKFERAVKEVGKLYPVVAGRLSWDGKKGGEWWVCTFFPFMSGGEIGKD